MYHLARVAGWEPHDLHNLPHVSWVGLYSTCPAQHAITAGWDLDNLAVDYISVHDLPRLCKVEHGQIDSTRNY